MQTKSSGSTNVAGLMQGVFYLNDHHNDFLIKYFMAFFTYIFDHIIYYLIYLYININIYTHSVIIICFTKYLRLTECVN